MKWTVPGKEHGMPRVGETLRSATQELKIFPADIQTFQPLSKETFVHSLRWGSPTCPRHLYHTIFPLLVFQLPFVYWSWLPKDAWKEMSLVECRNRTRIQKIWSPTKGGQLLLGCGSKSVSVVEKQFKSSGFQLYFSIPQKAFNSSWQTALSANPNRWEGIFLASSNSLQSSLPAASPLI